MIQQSTPCFDAVRRTLPPVWRGTSSSTSAQHLPNIRRRLAPTFRPPAPPLGTSSTRTLFSPVIDGARVHDRSIRKGGTARIDLGCEPAVKAARHQPLHALAAPEQFGAFVIGARQRLQERR